MPHLTRSMSSERPRSFVLRCAAFGLTAAMLGACTERFETDDEDVFEDAGTTIRDAGTRVDGSRPPMPPMVPMDAGQGMDSAVVNMGDASVQGGVPMFVAVGYGFRRVMSCDDGQTWQHDQVESSGGGDDGSLARGLGYGNGMFVAAVGGGGLTGRIFASSNGIDWGDPIIPTGIYHGFSDVAYGSGTFVAGGGHIAIRSVTGNSGWSTDTSMGQGGILRHIVAGGGRFAAVGGNRIQVSPDGSSWHAPMSGTCGEPEAIAYGSGRFLAVDLSGNTCLSADGGETWSNGSVGGNNIQGVVHTGTEFLVTSATQKFRSTNGVTWTSAAGGGPGHLARNPETGTIVGFNGTTFMRSTNASTFSTAVTPTSAGNRAITRIVFGYGDASASCPAD